MSIKLGDANDTVARWRQVMNAMYGPLYTRLHGELPTNTNVFGPRAREWQVEYQTRTGQLPNLPADQIGVVSDQDLADLKIVLPHRPIWFYTAPGSGAPWWVGPAFDAGEWCKHVLNLNHQPVGYPIGGYLGLMGGDPSLSYLDVIGDLDAELERLLDINPDVAVAMEARASNWQAPVDVELWFCAYSQSADGMKKSVNRLFGPGGKYERLRDRINGLILFGDPTRQPGRTKIGNTPVGSGISRWVAPAWLEGLTWSITVETTGDGQHAPDFYAACDDEIRPLFYEWFVRAETSLPFAIYCAQIIIPAILNFVAPFLGGLSGLTGQLALPILVAQTGASAGQLSPILGGVIGANEKPDPKLIEFLSIQGVLSNLPGLIKLLADLPGIAAHGDYYSPRAEFGGRGGVQVACDIVAGFRR